MKTQDFMNALGGINEKYLKDLLNEPTQTASAGIVSVSNSSGQKAVAEPVPEGKAKPVASGIFRYLMLAASAAACVGGIALLVLLGRQKPDMTSGDSNPPEVTEISTAATVPATTVTEAETTVSTDTVFSGEFAVLTTEQAVTEQSAVFVTADSETTVQTMTTETDTETSTAVTLTTSLYTAAEPSETTVMTTTTTTLNTTTTTTTTTETQPPYYIDTPPNEAPNNVLVKCIDLLTGEPLEGVVLSLIEMPNHDAKTVATWTSDSTGTHTFSGLTQTGDQWDPPYTVHVDKVPDGYYGGFDQIACWPYLYDYTQEITYLFVSDVVPKTISMSIRDVDDGTDLGDLGTTYSVDLADFSDPYTPKFTALYENVKPGEKIALPDGQYYAALDTIPLKGTIYEYRSGLGYDVLGSFMFDFTVTDGKPDKELVFRLEKDPFFDLRQNPPVDSME